MIHHLKIYPEHFSAVCTGIKRAELRKNDRDFKVGDTLHLMETPKGSCNPTGEFINTFVTHIADVGEWLPGYVMLSIEREPVYAAPQLPQPAVPDAISTRQAISKMEECDPCDSINVAYKYGWNACRAAMLRGAEAVSQPYTLRDGYCIMPMKLTAENGAKGALSGEFSETKFINCPECFGDDECETCDGSGRIEISVPVSWITIKEIWAKGVEHFAAAPQQEAE